MLGFEGCRGHLWWGYDSRGCPHQTELRIKQGNSVNGGKAQGMRSISAL